MRDLYFYSTIFLKQNLIVQSRLCNSLYLFGHSAFVTHECTSGTRRCLKKRGKETENRGRETRKDRRGWWLRERDSESHGTIDCRVPWGKSILQGHPRPPPSKVYPLSPHLLVTSFYQHSRVLNTRRKRKTARRPRHWLRSLYFVSTWTYSLYIYV